MSTIDLAHFRKLSTLINTIDSIDTKYLTRETFADDVPQDFLDQWLIYLKEKEKLAAILKEYDISWNK